ncbi:hypothetical protein ACFQ9V_09940 [Leifsonia sp. NPDC056665]|uniref:hypothetical protein n=1 Tax=Leifsonia sp. NPDC056665 TaxID=3345901 RepID=UPI0036977FC4
MSKNRVAMLKVVSKQLTVSAAAAAAEHLHRLLTRYREGGLDAVETTILGTATSPHRASEEVRNGRMHHLGIGANHRGTRILAMLDDTTVTVIALHTGEVPPTPSTPPEATGATNRKSPADGRALSE